jgi:hypothetical protein
MRRMRSYAWVEHDGGGRLGKINSGSLSIYISVTKPIVFETLHEGPELLRYVTKEGNIAGVGFDLLPQ